MKKGDMSINIIIIAAIALLVLVIIAVLLFRSGEGVRTGTSCEGIGGHCDAYASCWTTNDQYPGNWAPTPNFECTDSTEICCVKV